MRKWGKVKVNHQYRLTVFIAALWLGCPLRWPTNPEGSQAPSLFVLCQECTPLAKYLIDVTFSLLVLFWTWHLRSRWSLCKQILLTGNCFPQEQHDALTFYFLCAFLAAKATSTKRWQVPAFLFVTEKLFLTPSEKDSLPSITCHIQTI